MYRHIDFFFVTAAVYLYSFLSFRMFFEYRKPIAKRALPAAVCVLPVLALFCAFYPDELFSIISLFPPVLVIAVCFVFFRGTLRKKMSVIGIFYLSLIFAEGVSIFILSLLSLLNYIISGRLELPATLFVTADPFTLGAYTLIYSIILSVLFFRTLPRVRQNLDVMSSGPVLRLAVLYLLVFLTANTFFLLTYFYNGFLALVMSAVYFALIIFLACRALKTLNRFIDEEGRRTLLRLKHTQLTQQMEYSAELSREYRMTRRVSHDISGHLAAVSFLLDSGRTDEADDYINKLLNSHRKEETP